MVGCLEVAAPALELLVVQVLNALLIRMPLLFILWSRL